MTNGIQLQAQSQSGAPADLGFLLAQQFIGAPVAMTERHLQHLTELIASNRFTLPRNRSTGARITEKGTAIIEIHGVLINRSPYFGSYWGLSAYEGLTEQFRRLMTNDDVKRIVLDVDSPGGMVTGISDCASALEKLADAKPVSAVVHDQACSAGYWLACVADEISVTTDGQVGSIGVRMAHVSYAEMLDRAGVQVTSFHAGHTKVDGMPSLPLSSGAAAEWQHEIDRIYDRFAAHVAAHRPITDDQVRRTDARVFVGQDAIDAGLADRVETLEEMVARLESDASKVKKTRKAKTELGSRGGLAPAPERRPAAPDDEPAMGSKAKKGTSLMSEPTQAADAKLADQITEVITAMAAKGQSKTETAAPAATSDKDRIFAILESPEAKGRGDIAVELAKQGLSAEAAVAILKKTPAAAASEKSEGEQLGNALAAEMKKPGNAAGVKPESGEPAKRSPLAAKVAKKFAKSAR